MQDCAILQQQKKELNMLNLHFQKPYEHAVTKQASGINSFFP